jgi:hypothetical protein
MLYVAFFVCFMLSVDILNDVVLDVIILVERQLIEAATHRSGNSWNVHRDGNSSNALKGRQLIELFTHVLSHFR